GNGSNQANVTIGRRAPTSWVWPYFDKVFTNESDKYTVICKVCWDVKQTKKPKNYKWKPELWPETLEVTRDWARKARRGALAADKLNYMGMLLTCMSEFVIAVELPFSFGESPNYEYFNTVALQPQYLRVHRNTLKRHTQQAYYAYRGYLTEMFCTYYGHVSLTSDTWTSTFRESFVCVTVHWIDDDWFLPKRIFCFEAMEEAHNDFNIKTRIVNCCKNFHLVDKIFSISLDNATANTKAIDFLKEDPSINMLLGGSLMHVRCCTHILNVCVQEGLGELRLFVKSMTLGKKSNLIRYPRMMEFSIEVVARCHCVS
ncbi:putative AC transposase, partial [Bienertia sinuspersici]